MCVEDIGNVEVLLTDKTGTLTDGRISLRRCLSATGHASSYPLLLALLANQATVQDGAATGGNPLDVALWRAPDAAYQPVGDYRRVALLPFDHDRRLVSVLVDGPTGRQLITKGAPEELLMLCTTVPDGARTALDAALEAGDVQQLRQYVQRRRRIGVPALTADAALTDISRTTRAAPRRPLHRQIPAAHPPRTWVTINAARANRSSATRTPTCWHGPAEVPRRYPAASRARASRAEGSEVGEW